MSLTQFTTKNRNELAILLTIGLKQNKIAVLLEKTPSVISQEINRNKDENGIYIAKVAIQKTKERRLKANSRFKKIENNEWIQKYIIKKLKKYWSPEQIAGRIKLKWPDKLERHINKDTIYKYIHTQRKDLIKYFRCQKGKYRRRHGTRIREKNIVKKPKKKRDRLKDPKIIRMKKGKKLEDWGKGENQFCWGKWNKNPP